MSNDPDAELLATSQTSGRDAVEVEKIADQISKAEGGWTRPSEPLRLGSVSWTPALVNISKGRALHVHLSERIPNHIARRIRSAHSAGYEVHVACQVNDLYRSEFVIALAELDAYVYVLDDSSKSKRRHILAALADLAVPVSIEDRRVAAGSVWAQLSDGSANKRGHRLEALLAFLLGQVDDFRVFERNYRNDTQEIDIVLQVASHGARSWHRNKAFILVESKNTEDAIGQPQISLMFRKLETKRGSASIALFFSVAGYTSDAAVEEIRSSSTEYCVAMFDADDIAAAINAADLAQFFEDKVSRALLR